MQLTQDDIKNTHLYTHACMYIHPEMSVYYIYYSTLHYPSYVKSLNLSLSGKMRSMVNLHFFFLILMSFIFNSIKLY